MSGVVKTCSCRATYTHAEWLKLPFVGVNDMGDGDRLDLRNCACQSTIAVDLPPDTSVCVRCTRWIASGDLKICAPFGVLCVDCAQAAGIIVRAFRRSAA